MNWVGVTLVCLALGWTADGQATTPVLYYDTGDDIVSTALPLAVVQTAAPAAGRHICYSSNMLLYTNGNQVLHNGSVVVSSPNGEAIESLSCCCSLITITYSSNSMWWMRVYDTSSNEVTACHNLGSSKVVARCSTQYQVIVAFASNGLWIYDFNDVAGGTSYTHNVGLSNPRCIAYRQNSATDYTIFVANGGPAIQTLSLVGTTVTQQTENIIVLTNTVSVQCVDYLSDSQQGQVYFVYRFQTRFQVRRVPADSLTSASTDVTFQVQQPNENAAGIAVCDTNCQSTNCNAATCGCTAGSSCGFCVYSSSTCQCDNSAITTCCYSNQTVANSCEACVAALDISLVVTEPLALRRTGGDVTVVGITTVANTAIDVTRLARVGRFDPSNWPRPLGFTAITSTNPSMPRAGFRAGPGSRLRGSRFGVWRGAFNPPGTAPLQAVVGITTENSGFTNALYTYTRSAGDNVTLVAMTNTYVSRYIGTFRWAFTPVSGDDNFTPGTVNNNPPCIFTNNNRSECLLEGLQRNTHEGVWEVFRPSRILRVWHPIYFLFVRTCAAGRYGTMCQNTCGSCVNGECDDQCGGCICHAGWTGTDCNTACSDANTIGSSCNIACSTEFGAQDCANLLICRPRRAGCYCRSGLVPPTCRTACASGSWGPNCRNTCTGGAGATCNARTGA